MEDEELLLIEGSATSNLRFIPQLLTWNSVSVEWKIEELLLIEGSATSNLRMVPQLLT